MRKKKKKKAKELLQKNIEPLKKLENLESIEYSALTLYAQVQVVKTNKEESDGISFERALFKFIGSHRQKVEVLQIHSRMAPWEISQCYV